ncbi:PAS domain S-box-containing protein/diguanylate cyclase (GGDEF) domain-containing protein [Marinobacter antarcticus]|uniref:PAS domain S-box-containing protein/diguanylate cyclase (GGDEF) domain-containing protein n=1 Tax=Marinobacter antarcticus TaxID=564117 RepID=A0A1M6QL99_9GAMM|nr:EAL domain-containing protein [Marinobacter antarcticus]SHK21006.1 PAS domain S-box-containing protein/diguanylate cyclase (GGDEF) domain-containing protein [Marinobacter antarcticus]
MQFEQQQDFRALVDQYPRAIMIATKEPRIIYVNRMFRSVTGYQSDEVLGEPPSILSSGLHVPEFYQTMWQALSSKGRWEGLIWNRKRSGEIYPQWLSIYPMEYEGRQAYVGMFMDVGERTGADERLASLAYYDPLTELPNRSLFQEFLKARVSQYSREGARFAILFIDLDFFKSVNDLHGHEFGDGALRQAALCIQSVVRKGDVVARLSGDEFAVIIELPARDELGEVCQRMIQAFRAPVIIGQREYFLSASIGAAVYPSHGKSGAELWQKADRAMYAAKLAGRACYRLYSEADDEKGRLEQQLSEALTASLKTSSDEFHVMYQLQYDLCSRQAVGMEALLRWDHPEFGSVSPADFVPLAERRGQIHEMTQHLVRGIMADLRDAPPVLPGPFRLAINISARQITDARLRQAIGPLFARIREIGWLPEIEITETHIMHLSSQCLEILREFRDQGVGIAIDDFGTGYSSLAYLQNLPVQVLKIDRQFISRLGAKDSDSRIVSAILGIAEALELEVVAEGIETQAQYQTLCELECQRGQGFLMARPQPWQQIKRTIIDPCQ